MKTNVPTEDHAIIRDGLKLPITLNEEAGFLKKELQ
jgi:hypothetical protein